MWFVDRFSKYINETPLFFFSIKKGIASMTVPVYIAEVSPPHQRGQLVTINSLFITGGQLIASLIDGAFSYLSTDGWRYVSAPLDGLLFLVTFCERSVFVFFSFFFFLKPMFSLFPSGVWMTHRLNESKTNCAARKRQSKDLLSEFMGIMQLFEVCHWKMEIFKLWALLLILHSKLFSASSSPTLEKFGNDTLCITC